MRFVSGAWVGNHNYVPAPKAAAAPQVPKRARLGCQSPHRRWRTIESRND